LHLEPCIHLSSAQCHLPSLSGSLSANVNCPDSHMTLNFPPIVCITTAADHGSFGDFDFLRIPDKSWIFIWNLSNRSVEYIYQSIGLKENKKNKN
jgi:hypothetical protein